MENLYDILLSKSIIAIFDGDKTYGEYEVDGFRQIDIGMPYLSGPQIVELSVKFGCPQKYCINGKSKSRWEYFHQLIQYCIEENKCSILLTYLFSKEKVMQQYSRIPEELVDEIYQKVLSEVVKHINDELILTEKELAIENSTFVIRKRVEQFDINDFFSIDVKQCEISEKTMIKEDELCKNVLNALQCMQKTEAFRGFSENQLNDDLRNSLKMVYKNVSDQTRQGVSTTGKDAGNIDIQIADENGINTAIFEPMLLDSLKRDYIDIHIKKVLNNYDPIGCPYVYIIVYAKMTEFEKFWNKYKKYLEEYEYEFEVNSDLEEIDSSNDGYRHAKIFLKRRGKNIVVHYYVIHMK